MRSWWRWFLILGLVGTVLGAIDPLEGSLLILPSTGLAALGAYLGQRQRRVLLYRAFGLVVIGVGVMLGLTAIGGVGGSTGRSLWWALLLAHMWLAGSWGSSGRSSRWSRPSCALKRDPKPGQGSFRGLIAVPDYHNCIPAPTVRLHPRTHLPR